MQLRTNLGMSIGQMLASGVGGNDAFRQGQRDGYENQYRQAATDNLNTETELKRRQLELDPYDLAASEVGADGVLAKQLKGYSQTGDYGNGSMDVPNMMPDGTRNLSNSFRTEFIKPDNWNDETAKRYQRVLGPLKFALVQGEKNPANVIKAINDADQGAFVRGDSSQNINDMARRQAATKGDVLQIEQADRLNALQGVPIGSDSFKSLASVLSLGNKDRLYDANQSGVLNTATGDFVPNPNAQRPAQVKQHYDSKRGLMIDPETGVATPVTMPNGSRLPVDTPKQTQAKPLPIGAIKLQDDNLDAIATANSIKNDLISFMKQIDGGALNLGMFSNYLNKTKNFVGLSDDQSRNLQSFQATLEKLRNDSLRLNKGVQTEGDAIRAWNELLTNLNDKKAVRQRLYQIVQINNRAAKQRMSRNDALRQNYGADQMDYQPYYQQDSVIDAPKPTIVKTGTYQGRKVGRMSDGTVQFLE